MFYHWAILFTFISLGTGEDSYNVAEEVDTLTAAFMKIVCKNTDGNCNVNGEKGLILISDSDNKAIKGHKEIKKDSSVHIYCPGDGNFISQLPTAKYAEGYCQCNDVFMFPDVKDIVAINDLTCDSPPNAELSAVGNGEFTFGDLSRSYYDRYLVQFANNESLQSNPRDFNFVYSKDHCASIQVTCVWLPKDLLGKVYDFKMPRYDPMMCYSELTKFSDIFDRSKQEESFNIQLGGKQKYITSDGSDYLVPAPLIPPYFLGYDSISKIAASSCHNMVPQFDSIRKGNWYRTHSMLMNYLHYWNNWEHEMYFIRGGSLVVPGLSNPSLSVHAVKDKNGVVKTALPIPEYTAIIVIYRSSNQGYIFITLNNPYVTRAEAELMSHKLCSYGPYIRTGYSPSWNNNDMKLGFSFYCYVYDFFKHSELPYDPNLHFEKITSSLFINHDAL